MEDWENLDFVKLQELKANQKEMLTVITSQNEILITQSKLLTQQQEQLALLQKDQKTISSLLLELSTTQKDLKKMLTSTIKSIQEIKSVKTKEVDPLDLLTSLTTPFTESGSNQKVREYYRHIRKHEPVSFTRKEKLGLP